jgi:two-component system sensor histidine kinase AtoS
LSASEDPRAIDAVPAARPARAAGAALTAPDARSLLGAALDRLRERTGCEIAVAWIPGEDEAPAVAAFSGGPPPAAPTEAEYEAAIRLRGACALLAPGEGSLLRGIALRHGLAAAAPVVGRDGRALAVVLTGGADGAAARPRALAALAATAGRLALPLAAAEAERRLLRLDARVRQLDRLALLGRLAQELAHEVRNPLVSVKTFLQLLPERLDEPDFTGRFRGVVAGELDRALRLLEIAIDQPRPAGGSEEPAPVAATAASLALLLEPYARQRGVALESKLAEALAAVALGEDALRQVLLNLLLNAIDATPRGAAVELLAEARGGGVEITVSDPGPGIDPALRERVFEPFFSTRAGHHGGIGLAISRSLVEAAGGRVEVRDAPGGGAAFRVWLPAAG